MSPQPEQNDYGIKPDDVEIKVDENKQNLATRQEELEKKRDEQNKILSQKQAAEKKTLAEEKILAEKKAALIEEITTESKKSTWWRSFLGIFIKKYQLKAKKINLAKDIFIINNKKGKTDEEKNNLLDKIEEYTKVKDEINSKTEEATTNDDKKTPKSEISKKTDKKTEPQDEKQEEQIKENTAHQDKENKKNNTEEPVVQIRE